MMTARTASRRAPWRFAWRLATGDGSLATILFGLTFYLLILALVPQAPSDPLAADRWLIQAQARFGIATESLYRLGLFYLVDSPLSRPLLAAAAFLLLVRTVERAERLRHGHGSGQRRWSTLLAILSHAGPLLLLVGMLVGHLWGWRAEGLIGHVGERLNVAGHGEVLLGSTSSGLWSARPGPIVYTTGNGPQITVRAYDEEGTQLGLQRNLRETPVPEVTITLAPDSPDAYFAVPDVGLVGRVCLAPQADFSTDALLRLQVFRTPTGELIRQIELEAEGLELTVEGTRLEIDRSTYLILSIVYDPGRWLKGAGVIIGAIGLLSTLACLQRRSGQRQGIRPAFCLLLALLTLGTAGMALRNLATVGVLWDHSSFQAGLTAIWLAALGTELVLPRQENVQTAVGGKSE